MRAHAENWVQDPDTRDTAESLRQGQQYAWRNGNCEEDRISTPLNGLGISRSIHPDSIIGTALLALAAISPLIYLYMKAGVTAGYQLHNRSITHRHTSYFFSCFLTNYFLFSVLLHCSLRMCLLTSSLATHTPKHTHRNTHRNTHTHTEIHRRTHRRRNH